jgi:GNAT superfamily N-acetyltransferase
MDETPVRAGYVNAATGFAQALGFAPALPMARRELALPLPTERLESLRRHPNASPAGYTLITFEDRWPDEYIADRCELGRRMSTDTPAGEMELDEEEWDEERIRQIESLMAAQEHTKLTAAARHDASGRLVAFTEIVFRRSSPEMCWQDDTLVTREHRGHGLGFALKLANLERVLAAAPSVRSISTWNAAENDHMIAINDEMGFELVAHSTYWLKNLTTPDLPTN